MRIILDFRCTEGHVTEHLVENTVVTTTCSKCDAEAVRMISPVRCKLDQSFPGYADSWAREHTYHGDKAKRQRGESIG